MNQSVADWLPSQQSLAYRFARISRPKLNGFGSHEGVLLPSGLVVYLTQYHSICLVTVAEFAQGYKITIQFELPIALHEPAMRRLSALLQENKPYDLVLNNCEMFARQAVLQKPESRQVSYWLIFTVLGLVLATYTPVFINLSRLQRNL